MHMPTTDSAPSQEKPVSRFIRRLAILITIRYAVMSITIWAFLCGIAVLAIRAATGEPLARWAWILTGLVPCIAVAIILARRRLPERRTVRAMLDSRNSCGGLLMASEQADLGAWHSRMPVIEEPALRWRSGRLIGLALASMLFLLVSFLVPARAGLASDRPLDIARESEEIAAEIDVLKKEEIIDAAQAESLEAKLESIKEETKADDPAKTWEALDHFQKSLEKTAEEAAEKMARNNERMGAAQALSETLSQGGMDSKLMTEAMKELQSQVEAASGSQDGAPSLPDDVLKDLKSGSLSKEQLKQLANALKQQQGEMSKQLGKLRDSNLIDMKTLKQAEKAGKCDSSGLADFLKENEA